ncbi:MAG: alpha/beta hydrolase fold domain-containing protein [Fusobacteriaceae bacterium]
MYYYKKRKKNKLKGFFVIILVSILLGILVYIIKPELSKRYSDVIGNLELNNRVLVTANKVLGNKSNENLETNTIIKEEISVEEVKIDIVEVKIYKNEYKNVTYATISKEEKGKNIVKKLNVNIYRPLDSTELAPAIVYINGENWSFKKDQSENNIFYNHLKKLREKGIAVIDVQYRDVNEAVFPNQIYDIKGAIRFIKANAENYGIIPEKISVAGEGTGATLALLLGTTAGKEEFEGNIGGNKEYKSSVDSVISFGAVTDLINISQDFNEKILSKELAVKRFDEKDAPEAKLIDFNEEGWQGLKGIRALKREQQTKSYFWNKVHLTEMASPLYYVDKNSAPTFVSHGLLDKDSPIKQSLKLVDAFIMSDVENMYVSDSKGDGNEPNEDITNFALEWVTKRLKGKQL